MYIGGTADEEIYRYRVHAAEFWVNLTVAPGEYTVRLHWADTPETPWVEREGQWEPVSRPATVAINGETVIERLSVRKKAGPSRHTSASSRASGRAAASSRYASPPLPDMKR
jgi:hypothetical protein